MCKNCELAVPGLTTIVFQMDTLTKILMAVNQLFLCSWQLESLHWEAKGVYNGPEPVISEFTAIADFKQTPVKFITFMSCVFLSLSNYKLSERVKEFVMVTHELFLGSVVLITQIRSQKFTKWYFFRPWQTPCRNW